MDLGKIPLDVSGSGEARRWKAAMRSKDVLVV